MKSFINPILSSVIALVSTGSPEDDQMLDVNKPVDSNPRKSVTMSLVDHPLII